MSRCVVSRKCNHADDGKLVKSKDGQRSLTSLKSVRWHCVMPCPRDRDQLLTGGEPRPEPSIRMYTREYNVAICWSIIRSILCAGYSRVTAAPKPCRCRLTIVLKGNCRGPSSSSRVTNSGREEPNYRGSKILKKLPLASHLSVLNGGNQRQCRIESKNRTLRP